MRKVKYIFLCLTLILTTTSNADILHLELGAANYETRSTDSQEQKLSFLYKTVLDLIERDGARGTIFLNDISYSGLNVATQSLRKWLKDSGFSEIRVIDLPGNYTEIELPRVKSMHLGNPGHDQLPISDDDSYISDGLKRIASFSSTGLRITSYYHEGSGFNYMGITAKLIAPDPSWVLEATGKKGHRYTLPNGEAPEAHYSVFKNQDLSTRIYYLRKSDRRDCKFLLKL